MSEIKNENLSQKTLGEVSSQFFNVFWKNLKKVMEHGKIIFLALFILSAFFIYNDLVFYRNELNCTFSNFIQDLMFEVSATWAYYCMYFVTKSVLFVLFVFIIGAAIVEMHIISTFLIIACVNIIVFALDIDSSATVYDGLLIFVILPLSQVFIYKIIAFFASDFWSLFFEQKTKDNNSEKLDHSLFQSIKIKFKNIKNSARNYIKRCPIGNILWAVVMCAAFYLFLNFLIAKESVTSYNFIFKASILIYCLIIFLYVFVKSFYLAITNDITSPVPEKISVNKKHVLAVMFVGVATLLLAVIPYFNNQSSHKILWMSEASDKLSLNLIFHPDKYDFLDIPEKITFPSYYTEIEIFLTSFPKVTKNKDDSSNVAEVQTEKSGLKEIVLIPATTVEMKKGMKNIIRKIPLSNNVYMLFVSNEGKILYLLVKNNVVSRYKKLNPEQK